MLQQCSAKKDERDLKELLAAIAAMVASLWSIRRAARGILAVREV